ncbi:MAG TPA: caspase family protein [Hyphomicrobiaceae bacterium]|jgi:hypothetical protein|nr:caspase family protein [Hyphomicrobiaceae bacterium]
MGVLLMAAAPAAAQAPAESSKRVALVIGNSAYARVGKLENPARDADAVEKMLRRAGFETVEVMRDGISPWWKKETLARVARTL